jgi:hypothetical protein
MMQSKPLFLSLNRFSLGADTSREKCLSPQERNVGSLIGADTIITLPMIGLYALFAKRKDHNPVIFDGEGVER